MGELLAAIPDPVAEEGNFTLRMQNKGCTPEDFVSMRQKLDSGIADFKKLRQALQVPQETPCPWETAVANSEGA